MPSHRTGGPVTTLHDFGGVVGRPLDTFHLGSHNSMVTALGSCVKWVRSMGSTVRACQVVTCPGRQLSKTGRIHIYTHIHFLGTVSGPRAQETFELNQLKSTASQLLPVFQDLTGCKLVAIHLEWPISYFFFQVPANFFFIVMTTSQELGIDK